MNETSKTMSDQFPDRLSVNPGSPYYNEEILARDVGIRFKGAEKTNVEEYCISEGWVKDADGRSLHFPVDNYLEEASFWVTAQVAF